MKPNTSKDEERKQILNDIQTGKLVAGRNTSNNDEHDEIKGIDVEELAEFMHDTYEKASIAYGWKTNKDCKVTFWGLPEANRKVMLSLAMQVIGYINNHQEEI